MGWYFDFWKWVCKELGSDEVPGGGRRLQGVGHRAPQPSLGCPSHHPWVLSRARRTLLNRAASLRGILREVLARAGVGGPARAGPDRRPTGGAGVGFVPAPGCCRGHGGSGGEAPGKCQWPFGHTSSGREVLCLKCSCLSHFQ